jgi:tetratricopeptide (TPR) repeat protein
MISRTQRMLTGLVFLLILTLAFAGSLAFAQNTVIRGKITDPEKKPLPNVTVTLRDSSTGVKFVVKSKKDGSFMKLGIPPARYQVTLELEGYFPLEFPLQVNFGDDKENAFTMEKVPPKIGDDPDLAEAMKYFQESKYEEAVKYFQKGAAKFPRSVEIPYNLGISYLRSGRVDEAIASFEKAISLKPDLIDPYYALGECYFNKGDSDKALATFKKALELQPDSGRVYYNLGIIYYKNNMTDEAINYFEQAKKLSPDFTSTFYQLGLAYIKKGDFVRAIENLEKFLALEPNASEAAATKKMIEELKKQIK